MADIITLLSNYNAYLDTQTSFSDNTKKKYKNVVRTFLNDIHNNYMKYTFSKQDINNFITKKTKGDRRANNVKYALKNFLISIGQKEIANDLKPLKKKPRKKKFPYFQSNIMNTIINRLKEIHKKAAWIQTRTGTRYREAMTMRIQDISIPNEGNLIFITVADWAKGSKSRKVYIRKEHLPLINQLIKGRTFGYLILPDKCNNYDNKQMTKYLDLQMDYYNKALSKIGTELDIVGLSTHYIRHHFSDTFILRGGKLETLQKILGHVKIEDTQSYISVADYMATKQLSEMDTPM